MWEALVPLALSVLFSVLKNPNQVAGFKKALRKLRGVLNSLDLDGPVDTGLDAHG